MDFSRNATKWSKAARLLVAATVLGIAAPPAMAQFSDSYNFLKAVRERNGEDAEKYLSQPGTVIVNTKDNTSGETALHIVVTRRDATWLGYLLQKGANPNLADKKGTTPLMLATQIGYADGAKTLLKHKAAIDAANRSGETPLIRAVQLRNAEMVRLLLKSGANADKADAIAGLSARDYAKQDGRGSAILAIIEANDKEKATQKKAGDLDFTGVK